ncbi:site-specific integrase [Arcobacter sp. HD9-500m-PIT-SAG03]|nr:site-specific integrase [Arcobacter sp. HD9-500m-PIT-SAG03]
MKIERIKFEHPEFKRDITMLMFDNELDDDILEYLIHKARYGGHKGGIIGITSHSKLADKIAEMCFHLDDIFQIKWRDAVEYHFEVIRDRMAGILSEKIRDVRTLKDKNPIAYSSVDNKLCVWFDFLMYQKARGRTNIILNYSEYDMKKNQNVMLYHISLRDKNSKTIKRWNLLFGKNYKNNKRIALTKQEFDVLRERLRNIDLVYEVMAMFAVETALRIAAIFEVKVEDFNGHFMSTAIAKQKKIERPYIAKYDKNMYYEISAKIFKEIADKYVRREYYKRLDNHYDYCKNKGKQIFNENNFWLLESGKKVTQSDFRGALKKVSTQMGRNNSNRIVPHIFRHTCATWRIIEKSNIYGINLANTGFKPPAILTLEIQRLLGHSNDSTVMNYISSALTLFEIGERDDSIRMTERVFLRNKAVRKMMLKEAREELGEDFKEEDLLKYAKDKGEVV